MTAALLENVKAWLEETFPERQVYIRSEGRVQFFSFSPLLQGFLALSTLLFLGWVAFASVNVIFKDRIIAAKERHFHQLQSAYETRVATLQTSYDEVNTALVAAEDRFSDRAEALEAKQNAILTFLDRKHAADAALAGAARPVNAPPAQGLEPPPVANPINSAKPKKIRHSSFLGWGGQMDRWAGALFGKPRAPYSSASAQARHPALAKLSVQTARVGRIGTDEAVLMARAGSAAEHSVHEIDALLRRAGVDADSFAAREASRHGEGGPEIPIGESEALFSDPGFDRNYRNANATLVRISRLTSGMKRIPLTTPVAGSEFDYSSGFGGRTDPITGRYAFHPGIDFSGPFGSLVRATAPGVVVAAHYDGDYGNIVEVNHGGGLRTRYGHLSAFLVKPGMRVEKGSPVGRLGSTGRSTGPHVHYEVWYDGTLRNPKNFIEAGRYVLKQG